MSKELSVISNNSLRDFKYDESPRDLLFVHEFQDVNGLGILDNGWWQIVDGVAYNSLGGHHNYTPHPMEEFRVFKDWGDLYEHTTRDDSQTTGWISPDGEFFGCRRYDHHRLEMYVIKKGDCKELEANGWIKIYFNPLSLTGICDEYGYFGSPNKKQRKVLESKGIPPDRYCIDYYDPKILVEGTDG